MSAVKMLDLRDSAAFLGVSPRTARRLIDQRRLPFHRIGRCIRISSQDLDLFLERNRTEAEP